ncbi:MAG: serine hydrolase [Planctomycetaceae bacterium]|nr:serine hydrolase [Planctomycetaceae bacterium]
MQTERRFWACVALAIFSLLPSASGALGPSQVDAPRTAAPTGAADQDRAALVAKIDAYLDQHHNLDQFSGAILVADGGQVVYRGARGLANSDWGIPNAPETKFRIASVTKQFTAMAVLQLVRDGALELDAPIGRYLPNYPAEAGARVTIRHLLNHTSGIPSYTDRPDFMQKDAKERLSVDEFVETYCSDPLEFEPGTEFRYNNSGYFLLGAILERVAGKPYAAVLEERIFAPLGMADSGVDDQYRVIPGRATGYEDLLGGRSVAMWMDMSTPFAAGAMYSTVGDLWKWDQALRAKTLLDGELEVAMTTPGLGDYGFGWLVSELPPEAGDGETVAPARVVLHHAGGMPGVSTLIWRVPSLGRCIVVLGNSWETAAHPIRRGIHEILAGRDPGPVRARGDLEIARMVLTDGAERALAALATWPEHVRENYMKRDLGGIAEGLCEQERWDEARALAAFVGLAFPGDPEVWATVGGVQRRAGDREAALASYRKGIELDPESTTLRAAIGELEPK